MNPQNPTFTDPSLTDTHDNSISQAYDPDKIDDLPEDLQDCLRDIIRNCEKEDDYIRKQQLRQWKKNERFWHGLQYIFWSEVNGDWMSPVDTRMSDDSLHGNRDGADGPYYDFVINQYKAHGESIIAALAAQMPAVRFPPDNADSDDDLTTSKTYGKISDLIQRHNKSKIALFKILFNAWNSGSYFIYHYNKADRKYGTVSIPNYKMVSQCSTCGQEGDGTCPQCGIPNLMQQILTGNTDAPKSRVCWEIFGPLFVKVSYWSQEQKDFGYLIKSLDMPVAKLKDMFPLLAPKISGGESNAYDITEKIARSPSQYAYGTNNNPSLGTWREVWLRPWQFEALGEDLRDKINELKIRFPEGCRVQFVKDLYAGSNPECMDKMWTVGKAGLSNYIHADPLGQGLIPLQEAKNTIFNLKLETMEQGIATTYADPDVLNFQDFARHELRPGMVVPARAKKGESLGQSFYVGPKAELSGEVVELERQVQLDSEFVSGDNPSIYGGLSEEGGRTASEYETSKQQSLQRLSIVWSLLNVTWAELMGKSVTLYKEALLGDENYVIKEKGNYVNVWIKKAELTGKVGEVEAEGADSFPVTLAQKQSLLFKLIGLNNSMLNEVFMNIENRSVIANALAFPELTLPQEDQRMKQTSENNSMIASGVTLPIDPIIDDDGVHIDVGVDFLVSEEGRMLKTQTPLAYQAIEQHIQAHKQNQSQIQQQQAAAQLQQQMQVMQVKQAVNSIPPLSSRKPEGETSNAPQPDTNRP